MKKLLILSALLLSTNYTFSCSAPQKSFTENQDHPTKDAIENCNEQGRKLTQSEKASIAVLKQRGQNYGHGTGFYPKPSDEETN